MRWRVEAIDDIGEGRFVTVYAPTEAKARQIAESRGLLIHDVYELPSLAKQRPKYFITVDFTPSAGMKLKALSEKSGMTQTAIMSRLLEWYAQQDEVIQSAIMWP